MAGGVGTSRPFAFNTKCLVYSGALAGLYWYLPPKRPEVVVGYLLGGYVALAWYDELYDCSDKMKPGALQPLTGWMKPAVGADGTYGGKKSCCSGCAKGKKKCDGDAIFS